MNYTLEKYYTCKYDRPFKEIFLNERNKNLLKKLLELILEEKILNIKLKPTERNTSNIKLRRKYYDALVYTKDKKIEIEINSTGEEYIYPRNMAYLCDLYSHSILVGENYDEKIMYIQINLTYGLGKNNRNISRYNITSEEGKLFVKNFKIIEINMDYYVNLWYNYEKEKNHDVIEKNKLLIMLGLEKEELEKLSNNYMEVKEYMNELDKINEDPEFREYMSYEEDQRKINNTKMQKAKEIGLEKGMKKGLEQGIEQEKINIAKNLLKLNLNIELISKSTGLSIEKIKNITIH